MVFGKAILAQAAGLETVQVNDSVSVQVDYCLINDAVSHQSIDYLTDEDVLFNKQQVAVIIDHDTPSGSESSSMIQRKLINFAKKHDTIYYHGEGVGYQLMLDNYVKQGQIIAGTGEHMAVFGAAGALGLTVKPELLANVLKTGVLDLEVPEFVNIKLTGQVGAGVYAKDIMLTVIREFGDHLAGKIIVFSGETCTALTRNDKITICNLAGKTKAVSAVFPADESCCDNDMYDAVYRLVVSTVRPAIVKPDSYEEIVPVQELAGMRVNEVFIGGCAAGRIEDLRLAADIIRGKKVAKGVRLLVAPITSAVYVQALQEGLLTEFIDAGAVVMNQGCSVCWGKSQGIIDTDEVLLSAGSYNSKGWSGAATAKIYIASAATAAASAMAGVITAAKGV